MPEKTLSSSRGLSSLAGQEGAIRGQQVRHQLARHRQRRSIVMASLVFGLAMNFAQLLIHQGSNLGCFDQHTLQMPITLLG